MLVSIVIPAYNEEAAIGDHLEAVVAFGEARSLEFEVIVVDDGSADRTAERVREAAARHPQVRLHALGRNRGKGRAVREGLLAAQGDIRGFTDADASTPIAELDRALALFESGAEVVIGSRAVKDPATVVKTKLHRKVMGRVFNGLLRGILRLRDRNGRPIADTQCGFKWFTAEACQAILPRITTDGFAFDVEILYLANRLGFAVAEMPVNWADHGESKVNLLVDPVKMLCRVLTVPLKHRRARR